MNTLTDAIQANDTDGVLRIYQGEFLASVAHNLPSTYARWRDEAHARIRGAVVPFLLTAAADHYTAGDFTKCQALGIHLARLNCSTPDVIWQTEHSREVDAAPEAVPDTAHSQFVGRKEEVKRLLDLFRSQQRQETTLAVVEGEPGIGKTRLAERLSRIAALQGSKIFSCKCYEAEQHVPFGTALGLLEDCGGPTTRQEVTAALARVIGAFSSDMQANPLASLSKPLLFDVISSALKSITGGKNVLLWLDDFQWADESSIEWLHYFSRSRPDFAIFLLVCKRASPICDTTWVDHDPTAHVVELGTMSESDLSSIVRSVRNHCDDEEIERIARKCGGNPFYAIELAKHSELSHSTSEGAQNVPRPIKKLIASTVENLSADARNLVELMSAANVRLVPDSIHRMLELSFPKVVSVVNELEQARIIRGPGIQFAHDLFRASIYGSMSENIRALRHRQLYCELLPSSDAATLTLHSARAGLRPEALHHAGLAAEEATSLLAYEEARHFRQVAVENADSDEERRVALTKMISLLNLQGRQAEGREYAAECLPLHAAAGDSNGVALCRVTSVFADLIDRRRSVDELWHETAMLINRIVPPADPVLIYSIANLVGSFHAYTSNPAELARVLSQIERRAEHLCPTEQAYILARIATLHSYNDPLRALSVSDEAVSIAEGTRNAALVLQCVSARGSSKMIAGMYDEAMADFEKAESICKGDYRDLLFSVYTNRACIYYGRGDIGLAEQEHMKAMSCTGRPKILVLMNKASGLITSRRYQEALCLIRSVLEDNKMLQAAWVELAAQSLLGWALIECGSYEEAFECERVVKSHLDTCRLHTNDWSYTAVFLAKAAWLRKDIAEARRILEHALATDSYKTVFGEIRMEIALSEILLDEEIDLAYHYARSATALAERAKSHVMTQQASAILDAIRAKA